MLKSKVLFILFGIFTTTYIYGQSKDVDSTQIAIINSEIDQDSDYSTLKEIDILDRIKVNSISCKKNFNWCGTGNHFIQNNPNIRNRKPTKTEKIIGIVGSLISVGVFLRIHYKK